MFVKIGFLINPIAGMGGKVGLKGTDGVHDKALKLGAKNISLKKAKETLDFYEKNFSKKDHIKWYTCSNEMGEKVLKNAGIKKI